MTDVNGAKKPLVFVSYSKHDKAWKDDYLLVHLDGLENAGLISVWNDDDIDSGGEWLPPLVKAMHDAHVAVCLISPHYLKTKFIMNEEIPYLLQRSEKEGLHLKFMLVEPCAWQAHRWLNERQMFLRKGACVRTDYAGKEHLAFAMLAEHLLELMPGTEPAEIDKPLAVSPQIAAALAKMKADSDAAMATFTAADVAIARDGTAIGGGGALSGGLTWSEITRGGTADRDQGVISGGVLGGILDGGQKGYSTTVTLPDNGPTYPVLAEDLVDLERLPVTGSELFGRQAELQMLDEAWESEKTNIVSLVAWGGVGKSTLLNKWVEYLAADNYRGARRVFAWSFYSQGTNERVTSADAFVDEALRFFGEGEPALGSPWSRGERLADLVSREKALLLLDGMEPLQDAYQGIKDPALSRLIECLAVRNEGLCVITTREPVREFSDFPESTRQVDLEQISPEAGRALLRVKGIRGSDDQLEAASAAFGNHALAINLLASFLRDCEGRHVRFADDIPALADLKDDNHRHPRRVMAAFAERFGEGPELDLLHMMGLFDRPADAGCIAAIRMEPAVPGLTESLSELSELDWYKLLEKLRDLGLLAPASHYEPDELDAHPLVREHFGAALRDGYPDAWRAGHLRLYEHLQTVPEKDQPDTLTEMAPLFQAVHHGCAAGQHQEAYDKIHGARIRRGNEFYLVHKLGASGADLGVIASFFDSPWEQPAASLGEDDQAWLLTSAAFHLRALGRLRDAVTPMRVGLERVVQQEDWGNAAIAAGNLSELHLTLGNVVDAVAMGETGIEHADRSGDGFQRIGKRATLANALVQTRDLRVARALFEDAEEMQAKRQPAYPKLYGLHGYRYCDLLLTLGQAEEVDERALLTLEWATRASIDVLSAALDHLSLGRAALALGERDDARTQLDQAVDGLRKTGRLDYTPLGLLTRAALFREAEEYEKSRTDLDEAMRIAKRGEMRLHQCDAHLEYARLALAEGRPEAAQEPLANARRLVQETGYYRRDPDLQELSKILAPAPSGVS